MAQEIADQFMQALQAAEASRDVAPLTPLFADDATLRSAALSQRYDGAEGAEAFWQRYLDAFREIRSEFTAVTSADGRAVLEWVSRGKLPSGAPITYEGVSILETADGRIHAFRTYYDSAAFTPVVAAEKSGA